MKTNKYIVTKSLSIIGTHFWKYWTSIRKHSKYWRVTFIGKENELNENRNVLASQNTGKKRLWVVINKYAERQIDFSRPPVVPGTKLSSEASLFISLTLFSVGSTNSYSKITNKYQLKQEI